MDDVEAIARTMALYADYPAIQLVQTGLRKQIVDAWGIPRGAQVLEIGCGQGDLTAALAHAVGEEGHVTACDAAAPDYGAPISIGAATDHLQRSSLGARITFHLQHDVLAEAKTFPNDHFDYVVLAHCSWYFSSIERLAQTLVRVRPWARQLCVSEWVLVPQEAAQLAHMLAVVIQGQVEAFRTNSSANIRTPLTQEVLEGLVRASGWDELALSSIDSSSLQDGGWEISACISESARTALELGLPARFVDLVRTEVRLLEQIATRHGKRSLSSFALVAQRSR